MALSFTIGMLDRTMDDSEVDFKPDYRVMDPLSHEIVQVSKHFSIELVRVNHSIPDSTAVIIRTPMGVIVDSGDWRLRKVQLKRRSKV